MVWSHPQHAYILVLDAVFLFNSQQIAFFVKSPRGISPDTDLGVNFQRGRIRDMVIGIFSVHHLHLTGNGTAAVLCLRHIGVFVIDIAVFFQGEPILRNRFPRNLHAAGIDDHQRQMGTQLTAVTVAPGIRPAGRQVLVDPVVGIVLIQRSS